MPERLGQIVATVLAFAHPLSHELNAAAHLRCGAGDSRPRLQLSTDGPHPGFDADGDARYCALVPLGSAGYYALGGKL